MSIYLLLILLSLRHCCYFYYVYHSYCLLITFSSLICEVSHNDYHAYHGAYNDMLQMYLGVWPGLFGRNLADKTP